MNICVYGASSRTLDETYLKGGKELGREMAKRGHTLVFGGGDHGMMGAAAKGIKENGGKAIGVAPTFFNTGDILCKSCDEFIYTETMRERKQIMEDKSDAFIALPGGIGTFEELFEILTLKQLGRHSKPVAIFNINGYYDSIKDMFEKAVRENFMTKGCLELYGIFGTAEEVLDYIENYKSEECDLSTFKNIWK